MLETEIKNLTKAVNQLNETLLSTQGGPSGTNVGLTPAAPLTATTAPPVAQPAAPAAPQVPAPTAPPVAGPTVASTAPAAPPLGASAITHQQAQAELGAVVQALGNGDLVQGVMVKYGSARLNEIPAENLFSLVQECKALLVS